MGNILNLHIPSLPGGYMSYNSPLLETVIRRAPPGGGPTHHVYLARPTHVPQFIHKEVRFLDKRVGVWGKTVHSTTLEALSYIPVSKKPGGGR